MLLAHRHHAPGEVGGGGVGTHRLDHTAAVGRAQSGDEHEAVDAVTQARRQPGQHDPAGRVADQHEWSVVVPADHVGHVGREAVGGIGEGDLAHVARGVVTCGLAPGAASLPSRFAESAACARGRWR